MNNVIRLVEKDFLLDDRGDVLRLRTMEGKAATECVLVLFYTEHKDSQALVKLWTSAAAEVAGPQYTVCNLSVERKVNDALTRLRSKEEQSSQQRLFKAPPFIIAYHDGTPSKLFTGAISVAALVDFALAADILPLPD
ncbi:Hypothetical protein POVN_LOCUS443 [uncultured virus]|nr:Hypothetical protein POVN_LOCUS443 [uncultured virus]